MSKAAVNILVVLAAGAIYVCLGFLSGHTSINDGLGDQGPVYAAMVTNHDFRGGSAVHKLAPAFPLAAVIPYAATGGIVTSFAIVNIVAIALLAFAACLILDAHQASPMVKASTALSLAVLGLPTLTTSFNPAQPDLLGVALIALAVAACEAGGGGLVAAAIVTATQVGAALASPVGIVAPLFGLWRSWRLKRRAPAELIVFVPAMLVWLLVQFWARGGAGGLLDLIRPSRVMADVVMWDETAFILFGFYFIVTSLGGWTLLLCSRPRSIADAVREKPELIALLLPVLLFILTGGLEVPRMIPFLLPFWLIAIGMWARGQTPSLLVPVVVLATVLTLLTQHPWVKIDDVNYLVDWFPYSVHAGRVRVTMTDADLTTVWRMRVLIAGAGLVAFAAWSRRWPATRGG